MCNYNLKHNIMKKINYLLAIFVFLGFVALTSCKSNTKPEVKEEAKSETVTEEVEVVKTDTVAIEDTLNKEEAAVEEKEVETTVGM